MAKYKLIDVERLEELINEIQEYYNENNQLKYVLEDIKELINQNIRGGY